MFSNVKLFLRIEHLTDLLNKLLEIRSKIIIQRDLKLFFHFQSCIVAVVVPDVDVVKCWALENGIQGTFSALCENERVKQMILDDMLQWGRNAGLKTFEQVT